MANKAYYISLSRGLSGYYIKVLAAGEEVAREYACRYYENNWCSIYVQADIDRFRSKGWKTIVINENDPVGLGTSGRYE